jgi:hypothetical protein
LRSSRSGSRVNLTTALPLGATAAAARVAIASLGIDANTVQSAGKAQDNPPSILSWSQGNIWDNDGDPAELYGSSGALVSQMG